MSLETDAPTALLQVRSVFATLAHDAALSDTRPTGVAQSLGLHKSLARKLSHLVSSNSPHQIWENIPGKNGLDIAFKACIEAGATDQSVRAVRDALQQLDRVVTTYAQDREQFSCMLAELEPAAAESTLRSAREQMYRGASGTIGASTDMTVRMDVLIPPVGAGTADVLSAKGYFGFMRLRAGGAVELGRLTVVDIASGDTVSDTRSALFAAHGQAATEMRSPVWDAFTSPGNLPVERSPIAGSRTVVTDKLGRIPTGLPGRSNIVFAERINALPMRFRTETHTIGRHTHRIRFPSIKFCMLHVVHRSLAGDNTAATVHTLSSADPGDAGFDWDGTKVPCDIEVSPLGPALSWTDVPGEPRIASMLDQLIEQTGYDRAEFIGHKVVIDFPPVFCCVSLRYDLPSPPAQ